MPGPTLASHGTATIDTTMLVHWRAAVDEIVGALASVDEVDAIVTRERLAMWWRDGMTVAMAVDSVVAWIKIARPQVKADRDAASLRRMIALGAKS